MESLMGYALCAGIVYLVWKWRKKKKGSLSESNPKSNNDSHSAMPIATGDGAEQRISSLHREATELKSNGDLDRAIQCLREAENLKKKRQNYISNKTFFAPSPLFATKWKI